MFTIVAECSFEVPLIWQSLIFWNEAVGFFKLFIYASSNNFFYDQFDGMRSGSYIPEAIKDDMWKIIMSDFHTSLL